MVMLQSRCVFIDAGFGYGQPKKGVEHGPRRICSEYPNVEVITCDDIDNGSIDGSIEFVSSEVDRLKNIELVRSSNQSIFNATKKALDLDSCFPIIIGGDHSIAIGSVSAIATKYSKKLLVIWIDAHADINTPSSSKSGNAHGCPVSYLLGLWGPNNFDMDIIYIGIRDVEPQEWKIIEENKKRIKCITMEDYKRDGIKLLLETINCYESIHISLDIDSMDPTWCPSTGTSVPDGLTVDQVADILKLAKNTRKLKSMDLVEFNPLIGTPEDVEKTLNCIKSLLDIIMIKND